MQKEKGNVGSGKGIVILYTTANNQEKVVEVQKPIEEHESKVLKENGSKQLGCVFHDVYEVFRGLLKGRFTWGVP